MKFGYMAGFRSDLFSEVEFAKKHFYFAEITIQPELLKKFDVFLPDLKKTLGEFEVLGHVHWDIIDVAQIIKNVEALKELGAKKITIHPFQALNVEENARIFNEVNDFMKANQLELMIENVSSAPYNSVDKIEELFRKIPGASLTLDIGHANRILEVDKFINIFKNKIKHIHLHDNLGDLDHIFYSDIDSLAKILFKIKDMGYDGTVLLETFSVMKNGKNESQEFEAIKKLQIEQMEKIKSLKICQ